MYLPVFQKYVRSVTLGIAVAFCCLGWVGALDSPAWGVDSSVRTSTWHCLPAETALAVRIPQGKAFVDAFKNHTQLGKVLLQENRQQTVLEGLKKLAPKRWSKWQQQFADLGLTAEELWAFFGGEMGYAVVVVPGEAETPIALGLSWLQPGALLAERVHELIGKAIDFEDESEHPIVRIDTDLLGHEVMQLMLPTMKLNHPDDFDVPEDYDDLPLEKQRPLWDAAYKKWVRETETVIEFSTLLLCRRGEELLMVHSFRSAVNPEEHPDTEPLIELLAQLLDEQARGESQYVAQHEEHPGVAQVMQQEGIHAFEMIGNVAPFLQLPEDDEEESAAQQKILHLLGLESLGPFAACFSLAEDQFRSQLFLTLTQPRRGILQWCNQVPLALDPPAWVPANVIAYNQIGFDLGKAYAIAKEELLKQYPARFERYFSMVEGQVQGFAKSELTDLLGSLGNRHTMVDFEFESNLATDNDSSTIERTAMVWQLQNEPQWKALLKTLSPMVTMIPGGEIAAEQGYRGFRFKNSVLEGGLFLGNGNLVFAYGNQVLETTLSALNHPAQGANSFRGGDVYQQATTMVEPSPCLSYKVVDGARQAPMLRQELFELFSQLEELDAEAAEDLSESADEEAALEFVRIKLWQTIGKALLPTRKEVEGILGVTASRIAIDEYGLHGVSVQELPAPN